MRTTSYTYLTYKILMNVFCPYVPIPSCMHHCTCLLLYFYIYNTYIRTYIHTSIKVFNIGIIIYHTYESYDP